MVSFREVKIFRKIHLNCFWMNFSWTFLRNCKSEEKKNILVWSTNPFRFWRNNMKSKRPNNQIERNWRIHVFFSNEKKNTALFGIRKRFFLKKLKLIFVTSFTSKLQQSYWMLKKFLAAEKFYVGLCIQFILYSFSTYHIFSKTTQENKIIQHEQEYEKQKWKCFCQNWLKTFRTKLDQFFCSRRCRKSFWISVWKFFHLKSSNFGNPAHAKIISVHFLNQFIVKLKVNWFFSNKQPWQIQKVIFKC